MASNFDDPSLWRLLIGTVPFKMMEVDGDFEPESANITMRGLIPADRLVEFAVGAFPPPIQVGNISVPQPFGLPGLPAMVCRKMSFKSFVDGKPIDPFGFDSGASSDTYGKVIEVNLEFGASPIQQPDPEDPNTFLEITGNSSGNFLHSPAPNAKWKVKERNPTDPPDGQAPGVGTGFTPPEPGVELGTASNENDFVHSSSSQSTARNSRPVNSDPTTSVTIVAPQTEWTIKWKQIPYEVWVNKLVVRLRWLLGRVNSEKFPILFNALPETLLFVGFNYTQTYTWRDGLISAPPIDLEMKIIEKHVIWNGVIRGHNDFWRPGVGWETLLIDGVRPSYEGRDFMVMFKI